MNGGADLSYNIIPTSRVVRGIRNWVESLFTDEDEGLGYASMMTTCELIENAMKYGCSIDRKKGVGIVFECNVSDVAVRIKVSNRIICETDYENVKTHIGKINASSNAKELYAQRLADLVKNPRVGESKLGLYRIACEGEFSLKYEYEDMILTVIAQRNT